MKRRKCWSRSIGERGARVRMYEDGPGGLIFRSVSLNGKEVRKSLGHRDKELAIRQGYELINSLLANEQALDDETLTVGMLAKLYLESPQHASKKPVTQKSDARNLERVVAFLGANRDVATLSDSDVRRFTLARRNGDSVLKGVEPNRPVRNATIRTDLVILMAALNWGARERTTRGRRLLTEQPLLGVKILTELNPHRPMMTHDVYLKLLGVASRVDPQLELALIVAEGTGRRISAWRNLVWDDVDFAASTIRWRAEHDKKGYEQVVPMSSAVSNALMAQQLVHKAIGKAPVFHAPKDPTKPCSRHLFDDWLRRAYALAGITPERGAMWHAIRRKWATERKGYPVNDVAAAGGWRDIETLLTSYQQVDAETVKEIVLNPSRRIVTAR